MTAQPFELELVAEAPRSIWHKVPINIGAGVTQTVLTGKAWIVGWSLRGVAGAFTADIFDGDDANAPQLAAPARADTSDTTTYLGDRGIPVESGLTVAAVTSQVVGCIWVRRAVPA